MTSIDYFKSYEDLEIHELMLRDKVRNNAYRQAIFDNRDEITGKVVLDVGAGTGILSVFCAQAGAAKVYAVEASDIYKVAIDVIKENHFDKVVEVIHSRIEDVKLPEKVDVIVSEWMGFYLLHEGMLDSVIFARDNLLKPGGLIFPETVTLYSAPCSLPTMFDEWENVNGISMACFAERFRSNMAKPMLFKLPVENLLAEGEVVTWIDIREVTSEELNTVKNQHVAVTNRAGKYQGICLWFTCIFPSQVTEPVTLTTHPEEPPTHWKQTILVFPTQICVEQNEPIAYELVLNRDAEYHRRYKMEVTMLDPASVEHPEYCNCHLTKCILVRAMLDKYEQDSLAEVRKQSAENTS